MCLVIRSPSLLLRRKMLCLGSKGLQKTKQKDRNFGLDNGSDSPEGAMYPVQDR